VWYEGCGEWRGVVWGALELGAGAKVRWDVGTLGQGREKLRCQEAVRVPAVGGEVRVEDDDWAAVG
jgi:hypothetical protein